MSILAGPSAAPPERGAAAFGEVTPLNCGGQSKPFVYLNSPQEPDRRALGPNWLAKQKNPAFRRDFPCSHSINGTGLAVSLLAGSVALALTVGVLLLLAGLLAAALLLLTGLLSRILIWLALVRVILVRIGHSGNSLVE
jgi:hypothetical protein